VNNYALKIRSTNFSGTFISVINQLEAQNFCFTISFISCLYMFRAHVLIIGHEIKLIVKQHFVLQIG